jgi:hypothetical protein
MSLIQDWFSEQPKGQNTQMCKDIQKLNRRYKVHCDNIIERQRSWTHGYAGCQELSYIKYCNIAQYAIFKYFITATIQSAGFV